MSNGQSDPELIAGRSGSGQTVIAKGQIWRRERLSGQAQGSGRHAGQFRSIVRTGGATQFAGRIRHLLTKQETL
jgi:hypothetical protein